MDNQIKIIENLLDVHKDGWFLKGDLNLLKNTIIEFLDSNGKDFDIDTQTSLYKICMDNYGLFSLMLDRDLNLVPSHLRFALLSSTFYSSGIVETPEEIHEAVEEMVEKFGIDWYSIDEIGYRIFNLRDRVFRNPTLNQEVLIDEFENSGDVSNLIAILENPKCPERLKETIRDRSHFIFEEQEEDELEELIATVESME